MPVTGQCFRTRHLQVPTALQRSSLLRTSSAARRHASTAGLSAQLQRRARKSPRHLAGLLSTRRHESTAAAHTKDVAVLGGGITGLAAAWYITQEFPEAKVTIYDRNQRLGGWIHSKVVDVGDGEVIFETGPRSLRPQAPNGTVSLRLAQALNMESELLVTRKSSPSAQNRFIYYPDHLVKMPGPGQGIFEILKNIWSEPIFQGLPSAVVGELGRDSRPHHVKDESVGGFISRRFNINIANNMASALFHGIYAGDIWQLSARSLMPLPWAQESRQENLFSAFWDAMRHKMSWSFCDDVEIQMQLQEGGWSSSMREKMNDCSVFSFQKGVGSLSDRLFHRLEHNRNVTIRTGVQPVSIEPDTRTNGVLISTKPDSTDVQTINHTHIISTIASPALAEMVPSSLLEARSTTDLTFRGISKLAHTRAVTVAVVNFYFRTPNLLQRTIPPGGLPGGLPNGLQGFGYLIPQSIPFEQNPERALGVIFDSDISPDLWTSVPREQLGTRLTVMLGGHWWDDWVPSDYPSSAECEEMARSVLERHLGITEIPAATNVALQENCIPQYYVGHEERMGEAHKALVSLYNGRVKVAGSWYTGVGVNDCLRSAYDVVQGMKKANADERTGLERFAWGRPMALVRRAKPGEVEIVKVDESARAQGFLSDIQRRGHDE